MCVYIYIYPFQNSTKLLTFNCNSPPKRKALRNIYTKYNKEWEISFNKELFQIK